MRKDLKFGVVVSVLLVGGVGGYFVFRGGEKPIPIVQNTAPVDASKVATKPGQPDKLTDRSSPKPRPTNATPDRSANRDRLANNADGPKPAATNPAATVAVRPAASNSADSRIASGNSTNPTTINPTGSDSGPTRPLAGNSQPTATQPQVGTASGGGNPQSGKSTEPAPINQIATSSTPPNSSSPLAGSSPQTSGAVVQTGDPTGAAASPGPGVNSADPQRPSAGGIQPNATPSASRATTNSNHPLPQDKNANPSSPTAASNRPSAIASNPSATPSNSSIMPGSGINAGPASTTPNGSGGSSPAIPAGKTSIVSSATGTLTGRSSTPNVPASSPSAKVETHKVQPGDTLASLAQNYYGNEKHAKFLLASNPDVKDSSKLVVGSIVKIPPQPETANSSKNPAPSHADKIGPGRTYKVQAGDSFYSISKNVLGDAGRWKELFELNKSLVNGDATALQIGQQLKLP